MLHRVLVAATILSGMAVASSVLADTVNGQVGLKGDPISLSGVNQHQPSVETDVMDMQRFCKVAIAVRAGRVGGPGDQGPDVKVLVALEQFPTKDARFRISSQKDSLIYSFKQNNSAPVEVVFTVSERYAKVVLNGGAMANQTDYDASAFVTPLPCGS